MDYVSKEEFEALKERYYDLRFWLIEVMENNPVGKLLLCKEIGGKKYIEIDSKMKELNNIILEGNELTKQNYEFEISKLLPDKKDTTYFAKELAQAYKNQTMNKSKIYDTVYNKDI